MADPAIPDLGQFPLVQLGLFIVTVGGGLVVWWRGQRKKLAGDDNKWIEGGGIRLFFDGPLKTALDKFEGMYRELVEMRRENERTVAGSREQHKDELEILNRVRETLEKILEELRELPSLSPRRRR